MSGPLSLGAALKRGALVTAANWPVVLIDFLLESFYKLAFAVPVLGGALMVAAIVGTDLQGVVAEGVRPTADLVVSSLATAPVALMSFLVALSIVAFGGGAVMFTLKAGTFAVIVSGERVAGDVHRMPIDTESLWRGAAYSLEAVFDGTTRFGRRALTLALGLGSAYFVVGGAYLAVMSYGFALAVRTSWTPAWPILVLVSTTVGAVTIMGGNLAYDLLRVIIITDDCSVRDAVRRLRHFVVEDARQVIGIFSVMGSVTIVATTAAIFAAAGLALAAWVPVLGLIIVPLQAAAWIARELVFQYTALAALAAYQSQYRRFSSAHWNGVNGVPGDRSYTPIPMRPASGGETGA